jgi:hypothetical protein
MTIFSRIVSGMYLLQTALVVFFNTPLFYGVTAGIAFLALGMSKYVLTLPLSHTALIVLLRVIYTYMFTLLYAYSVHQATSLPGGSQLSAFASLRQCWRNFFELFVLGTFNVCLGMPLFLLSDLLRFCYGISLLVVVDLIICAYVPLVLEGPKRSFTELMQQTWIVAGRIWPEALLGTVLITGFVLLMPTEYTYFGRDAQLMYFLGMWSSGILVAVNGILASVVYRHYTRSRRDELEELKSPFFQ